MFQRVSISALAVAAVSSRILGTPTLIDLGTLPDRLSSSAASISADGTIVVGSSVDRAYRWATPGPMQLLNLGQFFFAPSSAVAVSGDGSSIVGVFVTLFPDRHHGFIWTASDGMVEIPPLAGGPDCFPQALSADGEVVVGYSRMSNPAGKLQAFRWTRQELMALPMLPDGEESFAYDVSEDGTVIVGEIRSQHWNRAVRWIGAGVEELGTIGGTDSRAYSVASDGNTVVGRSTLNGGVGEYHAFRWTRTGGMVDLGTLPGDTYSLLHGITGDGQIAIGTRGAGGDPLLWNAANGFMPLRELLIAAGVALGDWELDEVNAVSSDGTALAGTGRRNGATRAWLLAGLPEIIPPSPCADVSGDGVVNFVDITGVLTYWGGASVFGDADNDGAVDFADITFVLTHWGAACQ